MNLKYTSEDLIDKNMSNEVLNIRNLKSTGTYIYKFLCILLKKEKNITCLSFFHFSDPEDDVSVEVSI